MIYHTEFMRVTDSSGKTLIVYCDPDRLQQHMSELSPTDALLIAGLADGIRAFTRFDMSLMRMKPRELMTAADGMALGRRMMPFLGPLMRWGRVSAQEFAVRFRDPFLRRAFPQVFAWPDIPMMVGLSLLAYMHMHNAGFPVGGSLEFARAIERRYLELGGEIHYKAQVEKVLVDGNKAVGVRLYDDSEHRADVVISAADGRATLYHLLDGRFIDRTLQRRYDGRLPIHSQLQVSLGVNRDLADAPHWNMYLLDEPIVIAGQERHEIGVKHYCFDSTLAPAGKSVVEVMLPSDYDYWQRIYGRKLYDMEQLQVAEIVTDFLDGLHPGLCSQVEVTDVATPLSYERYTGNWQGSTCGWLLTKETMLMMILGVGNTMPGLENFYHIGQWVEPGGSVPLAAISGRNVIQLLCHREGIPFQVSTL
jgi:phytoene dehydrogenase-like protein